jgi:O-antigen biosynthesis protein
MSVELVKSATPNPAVATHGRFDLLAHPSCLLQPRRLSETAWHEHIPFAFACVDMVRPRRLVELGAHTGVSYAAFCQAIEHLGLDTLAYAIDTWTGDQHSGTYGPDVLADLRAHHDPLYGAFSQLIQSTFDDALQHFPGGSIDLLHIDGMHSYEAVKHDFESWRPKLSERAVVLLHDINERRAGFGVWRLWDELTARYPSFAFPFGHGLGVLAVGQFVPPGIAPLLHLPVDERRVVISFFHALAKHGLVGERDDLARRLGLAQQALEAVREEGAGAAAAARQHLEELAQARGQLAGQGTELHACARTTLASSSGSAPRRQPRSPRWARPALVTSSGSRPSCRTPATPSTTFPRILRR